MIANTEFTIKKWEEHTQHEYEVGAKLAHSTIEYEYSGDLQGSSHLQYQMFYFPDGTAKFVGLEHFEGQLGDRAGSFVLQHVGAFDGKISSGELTILPGSGTGELKGISGHTKLAAGDGQKFELEIEYSFGD